MDAVGSNLSSGDGAVHVSRVRKPERVAGIRAKHN